MGGKSLTLQYVINLTGNLVKQATANSKAVEQAAKRQEQAMKSADRAMQRSAQTQNLVARSTAARAVLSIRSEQQIQRQIAQTVAAYNRLARAGFKSASDQQRAYQAMRQQVAQLNQELGKTTRMQRTMGMLSKGVRGAASVAAGVTAGSMYITPKIRDANQREDALRNAAVVSLGQNATIEQYETEKLALKKIIDERSGTGAITWDAAYEGIMSGLGQGILNRATLDQESIDYMKFARVNDAGFKESVESKKIADAMGLAVKDVLDMNTVSGLEGGFEAADMAKHVPGQAMILKSKYQGAGEQEYAELLSMNQTMMKVAASPDQASTYANNYLTKMLAPEKLKRYEKEAGVDFTASLAKARAQGNGVIYAASDLAMQAIEKDPTMTDFRKAAPQLLAEINKASPEQREELMAKAEGTYKGAAIGKYFTDFQDAMAFFAMRDAMQNGSFKELTDKTKIEKSGGTVDRVYDYKKESKWQKDQAYQATKQVKTDAALEGPAGLLADIQTAFVKYADQYPELTTQLVGATEAVKTFSIGLAGMGAASLLTGGLFKGGAAATGGGILARLGALLGLGGATAAGGAAATGGATTTTAAAASAGGMSAGWLALPAIYASMLGVIASRIDNEDRANAPQRMRSSRFGMGENPGHSSYDPADYAIGAKTVAAAQSMMPNYAAMMASMQAQMLNQTVAGMAAKQEPQQVEIKDGKLNIGVTVSDNRTDIRTWVTQQLSHIQINAGATNPGGAAGGGK